MDPYTTPPPQKNEGLRKCAVGVERNDRNQGKCMGGGKKKMNRAENGDVKGTFNGYGDSDVYSVDVVHNACTGLCR